MSLKENLDSASREVEKWPKWQREGVGSIKLTLQDWKTRALKEAEDRGRLIDELWRRTNERDYWKERAEVPKLTYDEHGPCGVEGHAQKGRD